MARTTKPERKTQSLLVRMTPGQKRLITEAAARAGMPLSTWLLVIGLERARG